jgi:hypothetical protein
MAEPQKTQQEKEARWAAYRIDRDTQQQYWRAARARARGRSWIVGGAIVIILAVLIVAIKLL